MDDLQRCLVAYFAFSTMSPLPSSTTLMNTTIFSSVAMALHSTNGFENPSVFRIY
ncbi:MAG: hypothetical protein K2Z80_36265 [Xanthobacteraceae bacterium]|nr:hypothetical protein [Xanthobacteraceae bacterium]